jgi:Spy/CpxP family protein refolding chaperone
MNSKVKLVLCSLTLALIGIPAVVAADDDTVAVGPSPSQITESSKKPDGKRVQAALDQRLQQLDQKLQLTAEQKEKIREIWEKEAAAARGSGGKKDRQAAATVQKVQDEIRAILTPEQRTKFDGMKPGRRGGAGALPGKKAK